MFTLENHQLIKDFLNLIYGDTSVVSASIKARQKLDLYENRNYVYGDFDLTSMYKILSELKPKDGEIFYDLGSGGGRITMFAALAFPFAKCVGVEFFEELNNISKEVLTRLKIELPKAPFYHEENEPKIDFIHGDMLKTDVSDADIIYTYSTCFDAAFMLKLAHHLEKQLKPGARVITVTKALPSDKFKIIKEDKYDVEWGQATVFFQDKLI